MRKTRKNFSCIDDLKGNTYKNRNASFSFGTSRAQIKKLFVDEVARNASDLPGPAAYEKVNYFGKRQGEIACDSR